MTYGAVSENRLTVDDPRRDGDPFAEDVDDNRLAENAGALFSVTLSLVLVVALIALVFAFIRELRQDRVLVEAFVAPKDFSMFANDTDAIADSSGPVDASS